MKRVINRYLQDIRIPIIVMLFINVLFCYIIGIPNYQTSHLDDIIGNTYKATTNSILTTTSLSLIVISLVSLTPPIIYHLCKKNWKDIGFLLLIWLSPIALWIISYFLYKL